MTDWIGKYCIVDGEIRPVNDIPVDSSYWEKPVYEVLRVEEGVPLFIEDHFLRLENSFSLCGKQFSFSLTEFRETVAKLIKTNKIQDGPVKFIFPSGEYRHFVAYFMTPHRPSSDEYKYGIKTISLYEERNNPNAKIWNAPLREAATKLISKNEAYEAILIDKDGFITEGSRSNIFFVKDNTVYTTPDDRILPGITRKKVLEICFDKGIETKMMMVPYSKINKFDSAFLTGTSRKVVPVKCIDNHYFDTDNKLMRSIMGYFNELTAAYISKNKHNE
jgi:branched-chain amino acid aminotransferase